MFAKGYTPKKFSWLNKLKVLCHGHMLIMILMEKKIVGTFYEKEIVKNK